MSHIDWILIELVISPTIGIYLVNMDFVNNYKES